MNSKTNILHAIAWIDKQLEQPTRKIEIGKYLVIDDLNYTLSLWKVLLQEAEGYNLISAYNRTKLLKDFLTNEKAR